MKKNITKKDKKICLLVLFILFLGFGENAILLITRSGFCPKPVLYLLAPIALMSHYITPILSIIASFVVLMIYSSRRFFDSIEMLYIIVFGGILYLGYRYNVKLTKKAYLFPVVAVIAVPQLINTLIYMIFKEK